MLRILTEEESLKLSTEIYEDIEEFNVYLSRKFEGGCYIKLEHIPFTVVTPDISGYYLTVYVNTHSITLKVDADLLNKTQRENLKSLIEFACECNE